MNSDFQEYHSNFLKELFSEGCDLRFFEEMSVGKHRIDLGTSDYCYGIEIKSSIGDLKSGCGLNQENFAFGYVVAPLNIACQVIGYLYMCGMENTGFIGITNDDKYTLVKPAILNTRSKGSKNFNVIASLIGSADKIAHLFYEHNAIYDRE